MSDTLIAVLLALAAGMSYATAAVLQQRVASRQAPELSLSLRLIVAVVKRPLWLVGAGFDVGAYVLEATALAFGSIIVVAPLLVSGLLFALPLSTVGSPARVTRAEMVPAVMVAAGLAVFVVVGSPEGGGSQASLLGWILAGSVVAAIAGTAVLIGRRPGTPPNRRALLFGLATGTIYSLTAVLTKSTVDLFDDGVVAALGHWQPYALVVVSVAGLVLNQSAFQAGHVAASLPVISVTNPVLASTFGILLFDESLGAEGVGAWALTSAAIVAMIVGTIRLARSPLVTHDLDNATE